MTSDAQWSEPMFGGTVVADFKAFDSHVTLVVDGQYAASAFGSEMLCVEDGRFAWIASKSNVSISRVAGCLDVDDLFVDSTPNIDGTTRPRRVCGVLNGAPRRRLGAGIRIIPGRRYVERGVGLARGHGYAHKKHNKRQKFHARPPRKSTLQACAQSSLWPHFHKQIPIELNRQMCIVS